MNLPAEEQPDPATLPRFPQVPAPAPEQAPERLLSPIEEEIEQSRQRLLGKCRDKVAQIDQRLAEVALWNSSHPIDERVDPDPEGRLAKIRKELVTVLEEESTIPRQTARKEVL